MQKRTLQGKGLLFILITLLVLSSAAAYASTPSYEINGITGDYDFSDYFVHLNWGDIGTYASKDELDGSYLAGYPVTVKSLDDGYAFGVYKLSLTEDEYNFDWGSSELAFSSGGLNSEGTVPAGSTVTITEPGDYFVYFRYSKYVDEGYTGTFIKVDGPASVEPVVPPVRKTAKPTSSTVLIDGIAKSFDAYNIEGNNYFKIRDLAFVLNNTEAQFAVTWNEELRVINLVSNSPYAAVGGELTKGDGQTKNGLLNTAPIYQNGLLIELTAYNIGGNNYFKLRDVGETFDFDVTWDAATRTINIHTDRGYSGEL